MVKRNIIILFFLLFAIKIFSVSCNILVDFRARLYHINSFYAKFIQKVIDSTGLLLQECNGELWAKRPHYFNYHVLFPEESFLISNGKTLWFYDPYINQVTISWLEDVFDNVFLMLLFGSFEFDWDKYYFNRIGDSFFLVPKKEDDALFKKFEIEITKQGIIKKIDIFNQDGQHINYFLFHHNISLFDINKFTFILPDGVNVDEQR